MKWNKLDVDNLSQISKDIDRAIKLYDFNVAKKRTLEINELENQIINRDKELESFSMKLLTCINYFSYSKSQIIYTEREK